MAYSQSRLFLPPAARGIVVFKIWPSLNYNLRLAVSFLAILGGLAVQFLSSAFFPGGILLIAGNLLLLVSGYDNRVDIGKYDPSANWERVEMSKLQELLAFDRKIRKWDFSLLDVSNIAGAVVLGMLLLCLAILWEFGFSRIIIIDAIILLLPHWFTGIRSILVLPNLMVKAKTLRELLAKSEALLKNHQVQLLMLLKGKETQIPDDLKIKVSIAGQHPDFLGLYGQVVINTVQGKSYPYFYVVLVARQGYGMRQQFSRYSPPRNLTREFKEQDKVEVLVLRQTTTRTSGYHTNPTAIATILREGLALAEEVAVKK